MLRQLGSRGDYNKNRIQIILTSNALFLLLYVFSSLISSVPNSLIQYWETTEEPFADEAIFQGPLGYICFIAFKDC